MAEQNKISIIIQAVDKATATVKAINGTIARMAAPGRAASRALSGLVTQSGFHKVARAAGDVGKSFDRMMGSIRSVAAAGAVAAGAFGGMLFLLTRITNSGEAADKAAQSFGATVPEWLKLSYAAEQADLSTEDLGHSLGQLNKRAIAAATGNQEMSIWFQRAGISVRDQSGHVKSSTQLFAELADVFEKMPDGPKKLALANGLLKDSQGKMIPLLNGGSKALREAGAEAEAFGLINEKLTRDSKVFNNELKRTKAAARGVGSIIAGELLPHLNKMFPSINKWIEGNRGLIQSRATEWAKGLSEALPDIAAGLGFVGNVILWVVQQVNKIVQAIGGWGVVIAALGGLLAGKLIWSILMFAKSIKTLGLVMTLTPFGIFLIAIAAIAAGAFLIVKNWDKVSAWFSNFIDSVLKPVRELMENISGLVPDFIKGASAANGGTAAQTSPVMEAIAAQRKRQEVGGTININWNGPGRVTKAEAFGGIDLDIYSGLTPAGTG